MSDTEHPDPVVVEAIRVLARNLAAEGFALTGCRACGEPLFVPSGPGEFVVRTVEWEDNGRDSVIYPVPCRACGVNVPLLEIEFAADGDARTQAIRAAYLDERAPQ